MARFQTSTMCGVDGEDGGRGRGTKWRMVRGKVEVRGDACRPRRWRNGSRALSKGKRSWKRSWAKSYIEDNNHVHRIHLSFRIETTSSKDAGVIRHSTSTSLARMASGPGEHLSTAANPSLQHGQFSFFCCARAISHHQYTSELTLMPDASVTAHCAIRALFLFRPSTTPSGSQFPHRLIDQTQT